MTDILGQALFNHYHKLGKQKLWIHNRYGPKEEMPIKTYFREEDGMSDMDWLALNECRGEVLDIGAAAGCHAVLLQQRGTSVMALDVSPLSTQVLRERGIRQVTQADIFTYSQGRYDTLLLLMNGIGVAGTVTGLKQLLAQLRTLLNSGGQVLFDSSDVAYLYEGKLPDAAYYGEIWYQYEYKKQLSAWFPWLYVDEHTMQTMAAEAGFNMEVLLEDEYGQYLARLT